MSPDKDPPVQPGVYFDRKDERVFIYRRSRPVPALSEIRYRFCEKGLLHSLTLHYRHLKLCFLVCPLKILHFKPQPHNILLKPQFRLRLRCSDAPKRPSVANGFAILSQLTFTPVRRLAGCYVSALSGLEACWHPVPEGVT